MALEKNQFPGIHSKISKNWTSAIKIVFLGFAVMTPLLMIIMSIIILSSKVIIEVKILILVLTLLVIWLFVWLLNRQIQKRREKRITQIVIDSQGVHDYSNQELVRSLKYTELMPNPENGKYDVFIHSGQDTDMTLCFYVSDPATHEIKLQGFALNADFVITNGNALKKHFVKGIIIFRPDLKIDPGVFDLYGVTEITEV